MMGQASETVSIDYEELQRKLDQAVTEDQLFRAIVDSPFELKVESALLLLAMLSLSLANKKTGMIDRIALSNTALAEESIGVSAKRFEDTKIPLDNPDNYVALSIRTERPQDLTDWNQLLTPALTPKQARISQAGGGVGFSCIYPLVGTKTGGALVFSYYLFSGKIQPVQRKFMQTYTKMVSNRLKRQGF